MKFRIAILFAAVLLSPSAHSFVLEAEPEIIDSDFLDGYIGVGGGIVSQFAKDEGGTRPQVKLEFARLRKYISIDVRAGFGQSHNDYGALFRLYHHWSFSGRNSTGISLGAGLGGMYSTGYEPDPGESRSAYVDVIFAPFVRYIWDFGSGQGLALEVEGQIVPYTLFTNTEAGSDKDDDKRVRGRLMVGLSFLFELDR